MGVAEQPAADADQGDPHAAKQLLPLVYEELRKLAAANLAQEKPGQTLQATALVHEAYMRLVKGEEGRSSPQWRGRGHFFAAAAEAMRRILIDQARKKRRPKHGGERQRLELNEMVLPVDNRAEDLLALDDALTALQQCYVEAAPQSLAGVAGAPAIPGLVVYALPQPGHSYTVGADPAEGNPTSDDSALEVLDAGTGEEVACLAGKLQPAVLAAHASALGAWYNQACILVERNNHGHAVLLALHEQGALRCLAGHDGKDGWLSSQLGKVMLYDRCADAFRNGEVVLHSFATYAQLASIDGSTLRAPEGKPDDRADALALACAGRPDAGSAWGVERPFDRNAVGMMHPANVPLGVLLSLDAEVGRGPPGLTNPFAGPW